MKDVTDWLVGSNVIREDEIELYKYAIENLVLAVIPFSLSLMYGIYIGVPLESVCMFSFVLVSRKYLGGVHLKSKIGCLIVSTLILCMCDYMISSRINADIFCVPIILLLLSAWNLSPVESDCRPLDNREKQLYSVVSHVIIVMIMSVYFVAMVLGLKRLELCVSCATMLTGIAQMPVYFRS